MERGAGLGEVAPVTAELSVLIVNYNTWRECAGAIDSLRAHPPTRADGGPMPYECIVVDNCSPDRDPAGIAAVESALGRLRRDQDDPAAGQLVLHGENAGYSKGVNLALDRSRGRWILVSNPDLEFTPGLIPALQRHLERNPRAGCTVPKGFWDASQTVRLPPNTLPTIGDLLCTTLGEFVPALARRYSRRLVRSCVRIWLAERPLELRMMSGCLFLIERAFFEAIGRMDERFPLYYEDSDLSVRIRKAGRTVVQVPEARLVHFFNRSGHSDPSAMWQRYHVSRRLYYRKWYGRAGLWLLERCERLVQSKALARLRRPAPHGPVTDLGTSAGKPRIELPRACERFLLLLTLDPRFYLSGAWFGSGSVWTPSDATFANFEPATYFYRAYDLGGGGLQELGTWRFTLCAEPTRQAAPAGG